MRFITRAHNNGHRVFNAEGTVGRGIKSKSAEKEEIVKDLDGDHCTEQVVGNVPGQRRYSHAAKIKLSTYFCALWQR
jgi:hypothetical protein